MSTFTFTSSRVKEMRQKPHQIYGLMTIPSFPLPKIAPGDRRVRHFYREIPVLDGDGADTGERLRERVQDVGFDGSLRPAWLTVLMVEMLEMRAATAVYPYRMLDDLVAHACGFRTALSARTEWTARHPHSPTAKLIWFTLGDQRDRDRYLRRYVYRGGDYTGGGDDIIDDLPALTEAQLRELAAHSHQRDLKRRATTASNLAEQTLAQRVARLENASEAIREEIRCELQIMRDRRDRGLRKLKRQEGAA